MNNIEKIKELLKFAEENPELEIIPMVDNEVCAEDSGYWRGLIGDIKKEFYYQDDEEMIISMENIKDHLVDKTSYNCECENMTDDKFEEMIEKQIDHLKQSGEIKEAIIIYIELP